MTSPTQVSIHISANGTQANTELQRLSANFGKLQQDISSIDRSTAALTQSFSRMGHAAAAFASVSFSASGITQAADAWANLNAQLKISAGSALAGQQAYSDVLRIAMQTGQALDQVGIVYRRFADNATTLGLSQQKVAEITRTVSQSVALSGGSAASAEAALVQFGQALASGQLRGEELNSVLEQSPRLARALADGLGVPIGKLRELAEQGSITSDAIVDALSGQAGKIADEFGKLPLTIGRALTNLNTAWTNTIGGFEKSTGVFGSLAKGIDAVAQNMEGIAVAGGTLAAVMTGRVVSSMAASAYAALTAGAAKRALAAAELQAAQSAMTLAGAAANLTIAQTGSIGSTNALTAASTRLAAAQTAAAAASRGAIALSALGGPLGIVTTALTLGATAWAVWGNKAEEATSSAARSAIENIDSIIGKVEEMNTRLDQVTRKSFDSTVASAESGLKTVQANITQLQAELDAMDGAGTRFSPEGKDKQAQLNRYAQQEIILQKQLGEARAKSAEVGTAALSRFIETNAVGAEKIAIKQQKLLAEFSQGIAQTGGVLDLSNKKHKQAFDALNAAMAEAAKQSGSTTKSITESYAFLDNLAELQKEAHKELADRVKAEQDYHKALQDGIKPLEERARQMEDELENYGKTEAEIQRTIIARLEEARAVAAANEALPEHIQYLEREIEARKRIAAASEGRAVRDAAKKAAEEQSRQWQNIARDIERGLTDSLFRAFESGKSFGASFLDSIKNLLRSTVLRVLVQPVVGGITGMLGLSGVANASGVAGQAGGLSGLSGLKSVYDTVMGGFTSLANSVSFAAETAGQWLVNNTTGTLNQIGGKLMSNSYSLGSAASSLGGALAGYALGKMISGGYSAIGKSGNTAVATGTAIGSFWGPVGGAIGGAIGGIVNRAFGRGPKKITGSGIVGTFSDGNFSGQEYSSWKQKGGWFRSSKRGTSYTPLSGIADLALDNTFEALQDSVSALAHGIGGSVSAIQSYSKTINLSLHGLSEAQRQAAFDGVFADMANDMSALAMGTQAFVREGETAAQALERLATSLSFVNEISSRLNHRMLTSSVATANMASELVDLLGGMDRYTTLAQTYYTRLTPAQTQFTDAVTALRNALIDAGASSIPKTREEYKRLTEAQDLTTASGRKTYAALMNLAGAFADVVDNIESQIANLESQRLQIARQVVSERDGLVRQLLEMRDDTAGLMAMDLAAVDPLNREMWLFVNHLKLASESAQALEEAQRGHADMITQASSRLSSAGQQISDFVAQLRGAGRSARGAEAAYRADLAAARRGDPSASERIVQSAGVYADQIRSQSASATARDIGLTRLSNELAALPAVKSWAQQQVEATAKLSQDIAAQTAQMTTIQRSMNKDLAAALSSGFSTIDTSLNGLLSFDEMKTALKGIATDSQIRALIAAVDTNGDGQISKTELVEAAAKDTAKQVEIGAGTQIAEMRKLLSEQMMNSSYMIQLNSSINQLRNAIVDLNEAEKKKAQIAQFQAELESLKKKQESAAAAVNSGISSIWATAQKYGLSLMADAKTKATFAINEKGLFEAKYNQINYSGWDGPANAEKFKKEFYAKGGLYDQTYGQSKTLADLQKQLDDARKKIRDLGGVPQFAVGTNYVPNDMFAKIHKGERIIPAADNAQLFDALSSADRRDAALLSEIRRLREEVAQLRAEARSTAVHTAKTAKLLDRAMPDGDALMTRGAA